jgi:hypothetical protein
MLIHAIMIYLFCMPMGYMVGKMYMWSRVNRLEHTIDQEKELGNLSFLPYLTALLLPMGTILAINMIMQGDE